MSDRFYYQQLKKLGVCPGYKGKRRKKLSEWTPELKEEVVAACKSPGVAILLTTRNTFKNIWMGLLYSVFVLAAAFHAFNGFWTFLITWGALLKMRSQKAMVNISLGMMLLIGCIGLIAIWGSYWINLRN